MQHNGEAIALLARQQGLGMPLVEVWSGLLLRISNMNGQFEMVSKSALDEICLEQKQTPTQISLYDRPKIPVRSKLLTF